MLAQKVQLVNSELSGAIDPDNNTVVIEPNDRERGFGVAMELAEAIEFAKLILEMDAHLQAEFDSHYAEDRANDDLGRSESQAPHLW